MVETLQNKVIKQMNQLSEGLKELKALESKVNEGVEKAIQRMKNLEEERIRHWSRSK